LAVGAVVFVFGFLLVAVSPVCCDDGELNFGLSATTGGVTTGATGFASDFGELNFGLSTTTGATGFASDFGELNFGLSTTTGGFSTGLAVLGDPNFGLDEPIDGLLEGGLLLELPVEGGLDELLGGLLELLEGGLELDDGGLLELLGGLLEPLDLEGGLHEPLDCPKPSWTNVLAINAASTTGTSSFHVLIAWIPFGVELQIYNTKCVLSRSYFVESKHSKVSHTHFKTPSGVLKCL
jgi:hypothetical protein